MEGEGVALGAAVAALGLSNKVWRPRRYADPPRHQMLRSRRRFCVTVFYVLLGYSYLSFYVMHCGCRRRTKNTGNKTPPCLPEVKCRRNHSGCSNRLHAVLI